MLVERCDSNNLALLEQQTGVERIACKFTRSNSLTSAAAWQVLYLSIQSRKISESCYRSLPMTPRWSDSISHRSSGIYSIVARLLQKRVGPHIWFEETQVPSPPVSTPLFTLPSPFTEATLHYLEASRQNFPELVTVHIISSVHNVSSPSYT